MAGKIICFGEIMLRLATPRFQRFVQTTTFEATYGGGEANVCVSLANFGLNTSYVTKVPNNPLGQSAINEMRRYGVGVENIIKDGDRLGIYFLETGASQRPSKVIYDRKHSSISKVMPGEFNWDEIFKDAKWFHFSGITPALSDSAAEVTLEACQAAKERKIKISCDLNYRKNLWSTDKANKVMSQLMKYVDVAIANEEDADKVFGIKAESTDITLGELSDEGYKQVAVKLVENFGFEKVAITLRESKSASDNGWSALLYDGKEFYKSIKYDVHIVDRVGGGDSFASGIIYGLLQEMDCQQTLDFAVASSCLKHTIEGDFNMVTVDEVKTLMNGDGSGRVQR
ncbi:MAG: sugar kinase [Peptostreptococcaceae bacterium]|nr:sugar kinase [Peptostreptococcaceae bacterium]